MSDIVSSIKDAVNPKRREQATTPGTYDPHERGPYPDHPSAAVGNSKSQVEPPTTRTEQANTQNVGQAGNETGAEQLGAGTPKYGTDKGLNAPKGTYGPHGSRIANVLDPRVDSDRDGRPKHGVSGVGEVAGREVGGGKS